MNRIKIYQPPGQSAQVAEFIEGLEPNLRDKLVWQIFRLSRTPLSGLKEPHYKHFSIEKYRSLYELREKGRVAGVSAVAAGITAEPFWSPIYVGGQQVSMTAYNILRNNYVKLRDIGQAVGFNVYWDNGVQVDSTATPGRRQPQLQHRPCPPLTRNVYLKLSRIWNLFAKRLWS